MLYMIPDRNRIEETLKLSEKNQACFEYNDFCDPAVYSDEARTEELISFYSALDRDRSQDIMHGVFMEITPHSQDPSVRENSCRKMYRSMEIAERLGVKAVVFHTNTIPNFRDERYIQNWLDCNEKLIREMLDRYPTLEVLYENMFDITPDDLKLLAVRLQNEPRFGVCLDYAHVNVFALDKDVWVEKLGPYIRHIHVNDNNLKEDLHAAVGSGEIDWVRYEHQVRGKVNDASVLIETQDLEKFVESAEYMARNGMYPFAKEYKKLNADELKAQEMKKKSDLTKEELRKIVTACISLTNESDKNKLLARLLTIAMEITSCDAGTVYVKEKDTLVFRVMKTVSLGVELGSDGEPIDIPPVEIKEKNVCGYCAIHGELINIEDVYDSDRFHFEGPGKYDAITGYRSKSMILIPIQNEEKALVGVMQLINAKDSDGNIRTFTKDDEFVLRALSSMTAVLILNMSYIEQIRRQMNSFVASFATAVDQRTPYNGLHTRKVTYYTKLLAAELNRRYEAGLETEYYDEDRVENLRLASMLHDIGKMIVPLEIMNKETRLADRLQDIENRYELISALSERDFYKGVISEEQNNALHAELQRAMETIVKANPAGFLPNEELDKIHKIAERKYVREDGREIPFLTPDELECLNIRKGTLTPAERAVMESHAVMTKVILDKVYFSEKYANVPVIAASHHEMLDGSGYPNHLQADAISSDIRLLAVTDIYDALTSKDRPYKKVIPKDKAFQILYSMVDEGKLDRHMVEVLEIALKDITEEDVKAGIVDDNVLQ